MALVAQAAESVRSWVHFLPLVTTALAVPFLVSLLRRHRARPGGAHLLWWAVGVLCYGIGTGLEATITIFGNTVALTKAWYIAGALLGAYPLAQGTVFLLLRRAAALRWTFGTLPLVVVLSVLVVLSPVHAEALEQHRPSGAILAWKWVRALTPLINLYAALFLVGGAAVSCWRYARTRRNPARTLGNALIATGALLPAIGGGMAKAGTVEALYVGELVGLVLIGWGYVCCTRSP